MNRGTKVYVILKQMKMFFPLPHPFEGDNRTIIQVSPAAQVALAVIRDLRLVVSTTVVYLGFLIKCRTIVFIENLPTWYVSYISSFLFHFCVSDSESDSSSASGSDAGSLSH